MREFVTVTILVALGARASAEPSAEQLYDEGQQAFDRHDYATAISRWQSSFQLSQLPLLVFNIAQAYRLEGDCARALSTYRQYVTLDPTSEQRGVADDFIAELEPKCFQLPSPHAAHAPRHAEGTGAANSLRLAGLVTGGAGTALVVTGLLFGRRASTLGDEVTRDCTVSCSWRIEKLKQSDGQRDATVGKVLDVVGAAAIAAGIGLYLYGVREDESALIVQPQPTGATVSWSGRW